MTRRAFTLIETVVVVVILLVIATIALPRVVNMPRRAACANVLTTLRELESAANQYYAEFGDWPADGVSGEMPPGFEGHAPMGIFDKDGLPVGGKWDVENEINGFVGVGIHFEGSAQKRRDCDAILLDADRIADDGDLATGRWRYIDPDRYYVVLSEP